ncbi:MAG: amidase [Actinomycetes bacterium]
MTDPTRWPAVRVLRAFRSRELTPVEYLTLVGETIDATQPQVNALGDQYRNEAMAAAVVATQRYARQVGDLGPLEGLPVVVKDETEVAGRRSTNGSLLWSDAVSEDSDPFVERLLAAGAIIHARGLTPEFSVPFWTHSRMWGVTRNPWNLDFDVGGSSGGSAAALAAGMTPLATGSDIGGSIRVPASCCGVVGYMPPSGRIPVAGAWGRDDWSRVGPMARSVADCALVTELVSGAHPRDHFSLRDPVQIGAPDPDVRGMRIALSVDLGDWPVTAEVAATTRSAAEALEELGAIVTEVDVTIEREAVRKASLAHNAALFGVMLELEIAGREAEVNPYVLAWLRELDEARSPAAFFEGRQLEAALAERIDRLLVEHEIVLCPALCIPALEAGVDYTQTPLTVEGVQRDSFHDIHLTEAFNITSRCPVLTVPAGRGSTGVPIGLQIVGRSYCDASVFRVGSALESHRPWPVVADVAS